MDAITLLSQALGEREQILLSLAPAEHEGPLDNFCLAAMLAETALLLLLLT